MGIGEARQPGEPFAASQAPLGLPCATSWFAGWVQGGFQRVLDREGGQAGELFVVGCSLAALCCCLVFFGGVHGGFRQALDR